MLHTTQLRICLSKQHFDDDQFERRGLKRRLKKGAIPTKSSHLNVVEKTPAPERRGKDQVLQAWTNAVQHDHIYSSTLLKSKVKVSSTSYSFEGILPSSSPTNCVLHTSADSPSIFSLVNHQASWPRETKSQQIGP